MGLWYHNHYHSVWRLKLYFNFIYDIISTYGMILYMISDMISWPVFTVLCRHPRQRRLQYCCSCQCLAVSLPGLSCPDPALADTLVPDLLSLCDGHHLGAAPAVAPHPDVHLVEPAAVAPSHWVSAEALPRCQSSLKLCGIVGWLLPPMKHRMRGALPRHPSSFSLEKSTKFLELEKCASGFPILPQLSLVCSMSSPIRRCVLRNGT